jgi:O-antigen/teichoic acid export membrane protein
VAGAILVARQLGASPFGEYNLVQTTTGMLMALGGFGLNTTATRFLSGKYRADPCAAGRVIALSGAMSAAVGTLTAALLVVGAPWVARDLLGAPQLGPALRLGSLLLVLGPVNGTQLGVLMGLERFRLIAAVTTLAAAASVPLLVVGSRLAGMWGAVAALVVTELFTMVLYQGALRRVGRATGIRPRYRGALREWRVLLAYSAPLTLSNLLLAPVTWITSAFVANQMGGLRELGLFAAANQWRNAIVLVATSAGAVLLPLFSHLHDAGHVRSFSRAFWTSLAVTSATSVLVAGVLAVVSPTVMRAYGGEFGGAGRVLLVLVLVGALSAPLTIVGHAIAASGRMWLGFTLNLMWACASLCVAYSLRARGAMGLSLAHLAAYGAYLLAGVTCVAITLRRGTRGAASPTGAVRTVATRSAELTSA